MIVKLPSGYLVDLSKIATMSPPDKDGAVYVRFGNAAYAEFIGADGRVLYAAQLARVGKPDAAAVECLPQRRNPQHPTNCQCADCSADYAIRVRAEIETGARCPVCAKKRAYCICEGQK